MSAEKKILVIGATGLLGQPAARHLKANGFAVRVMGRDRTRTENIFGESMEVVVGDVQDMQSLESALDGCYGVHISVASEEGEAAGVKNVVTAAKARGVQRISYVSGTTVCEENAWFPLVRQKLAAEKAIEQSSIPHVIFRPTWFMEVLANLVKAKVAIIMGKHRTPYHLLAADDFAEMVARAYLLEETPNVTLQVHGPEAMLLREAVDRYRAVLHPEVKRLLALPYWLASIIAFIRRAEQMKWAVRFMKYFETVGEGAPTPETERLLGAPRTTLEQWLDNRRQGSR